MPVKLEFRMASAEIQSQWAELAPKTGFSFENYERNAKLINNKVVTIQLKFYM